MERGDPAACLDDSPPGGQAPATADRDGGAPPAPAGRPRGSHPVQDDFCVSTRTPARCRRTAAAWLAICPPRLLAGPPLNAGVSTCPTPDSADQRRWAIGAAVGCRTPAPLWAPRRTMPQRLHLQPIIVVDACMLSTEATLQTRKVMLPTRMLPCMPQHTGERAPAAPCASFCRHPARLAACWLPTQLHVSTANSIRRL